MSGAGWTQPLIIRVDSVLAGSINTFTVTQQGRRNAAVPTNPVSGTTGIGTGLDANGAGATFNLTWGAYAFGAVTQGGSFTAFPNIGDALTNVSGLGSGAAATITMGLLSVTVTEKGSGYTSIADAQVIFSGATGAAATAVLTTDTGAVGSATNQENAIVIRANTDELGSKVGDIVRQVSTRRYKVKTADGIATCKLVADDTPAFAEAYVVATAASGATYYVMKLTAHRATLATKTGDGALNGQAVQWTFSAPSGSIVQIENA
jgi:hypothetical protein